MALDQYALISLEEYFSFAKIQESQRLADALRIYCSQADATDATVTIEDNTMTLVITGGAEAGSTPIILTNPLYSSLALLVAYINTQTGWEAEREGWAEGTSADLVEIEATGCLGTDNEQTLKFYDNYIYEQMINRASQIAENYLNRNILSRDYSHDRYDGGHHEVYARNYPITSIRRISVGTMGVIRARNTDGAAFNAYATITETGVILTKDGASLAEITFAAEASLGEMATAINGETGWEAALLHADYSAWPSTLLYPTPNRYCAQSEWTDLNIPDEPLEEYELEADTGIINIGASTFAGFQNIFIDHTAGYATTPPAIASAVCRFVQEMDANRTSDQSTLQEKLGDYSYSNVDVSKILNPAQFTELRAYRRELSGGDA